MYDRKVKCLHPKDSHLKKKFSLPFFGLFSVFYLNGKRVSVEPNTFLF